MSWSVEMIGAPGAIVRNLDDYESTLYSASKDEFRDVKPHLVGLLDQCIGDSKLVVRLRANGHAGFEDGKKISGACYVALETFYGFVI